MAIKFDFYFDSGSVSTVCDEETKVSEFARRLMRARDNGSCWLDLPGKPEVVVNLAMVKAITRSEVEAQACLPEGEVQDDAVAC